MKHEWSDETIAKMASDMEEPQKAIFIATRRVQKELTSSLNPFVGRKIDENLRKEILSSVSTSLDRLRTLGVLASITEKASVKTEFGAVEDIGYADITVADRAAAADQLYFLLTVRLGGAYIVDTL